MVVSIIFCIFVIEKETNKSYKIMKSNKNQNKVKKGVKIYHANGLIPDLGKEKNFKIYIPASAIEKI